MTEKILLFSSCGPNEPPAELLKNFSDFSTKESRQGPVIDFLLSLDPVAQDNLPSVLSSFRKETKYGHIIRTVNATNEDVYYYLDISGHIHTMEIAKVDSTRPWRISEYDGAEYIDYLDESTISGGPPISDLVLCSFCTYYRKGCPGLIKLKNGTHWHVGGCLYGRRKRNETEEDSNI